MLAFRTLLLLSAALLARGELGVCGGEGDNPSQNGVGQAACEDGFPCEEGLEVLGCMPGGALCRLCGGEGEACCVNDEPCNSGLLCSNPEFLGVSGGICESCGTQVEFVQACQEAPRCEAGLVPKIDKNSGKAGTAFLFCRPPKACGSERDAPCCTDGAAACGANLTCIDSFANAAKTCQPCGGKGEIPCDDACQEGLQLERGFCRDPSAPTCGMLGEPCCEGAQSEGSSPACLQKKLACAFGEDDYNDLVCKPCGALGEQACSGIDEARNNIDICDEGLVDEYDEYGPTLVNRCVEQPQPDVITCGFLDAPVCSGVFLPILSYLGDYSDVDYEVGCPCGQGLVEEGGVCVLAPSRSSSGATPPGVTPPMTPLAPLPVEPAAPVDTELPAPTGTPVDTEAPIDMSPPDVPTSMGAPVENAEAPVDTVAAPVDNDAEPSEDLFGSYGEVEVAYGI